MQLIAKSTENQRSGCMFRPAQSATEGFTSMTLENHPENHHAIA
jgi:hypothetical protein